MNFHLLTLTLEMASCGNKSKDITPHDKAILNRIFNPNLPYTEYDEEETPDEAAGIK